MFTLTVGSEALTLCSECMHFIEEPHRAAGMPGLLLATLTSEISQDKFWEISRFWSLKDTHYQSPDHIHSLHASSKRNLGRHKLDNTVLLHSSPTQVKIIWDMNGPFGFKYKLLLFQNSFKYLILCLSWFLFWFFLTCTVIINYSQKLFPCCVCLVFCLTK